jgi:oligopeptide transport system substrate-binding protein
MLRLLLIPIALLALLAGALAWSGGGGAQSRADFAFINRGDIYTLDLNQMSYMQDFRLTYGIREGLYAPDPKTLKPIPAGAVSHMVSDDGRVWTFKLRPEAKWSNGDPVTAHDYVFSWRRMLEEPGEYTYLFYYIKNAKEYEDSYTAGKPIPFESVGMKALDDHTFELTLVDPVPYLLELAAFPIFYPRNEKSMESFKLVLPNGKYTYNNAYTRPPWVVTNGPFKLSNWDFNRRLILTKSDTYWDRANVKSDSIEMVVNDNPLSAFLQYETAQVDWQSDVPGDLAAQLYQNKRGDLRSSPAFATAFITFMCRPQTPPSAGSIKNPLADVRVRQALAMAIDKRVITKDVTRMGELIARTYLPPDGTLDFRWLPGPYDKRRQAQQPYTYQELQRFLDDPTPDAGPGLPYNIKEAQRLLAEAGYPNGQGFPSLPMLYNSDSVPRRQIVQVLKNQWKQNLNIDVNIQTVEGKIYKQRVSQKDYVIGLAAWYGDYPDASTFTDKYLSTSLQNDSDWQNKSFDGLCFQATKEADMDKRIALLSRAENMIDTEVPVVPLYHYVNVSLSRDNVHGCEPNPRNVTIFKGVWVEGSRQ